MPRYRVEFDSGHVVYTAEVERIQDACNRAMETVQHVFKVDKRPLVHHIVSAYEIDEDWNRVDREDTQ